MSDNTSICKTCGMVIKWVRTPRGKKMPLDALSGRWLKIGDGPDSGIAEDNGGLVHGTFAGVDIEEEFRSWRGGRICPPGKGLHARVFKSHFATCPQAALHRRGA